MSNYRLIAAHGTAVAQFDAVDQAAAQQCGRALAPCHATTRGTAYRLEVECDGLWREVFVWMPTRLTAVAPRPDGTIPPERTADLPDGAMQV